MRVEHRWGDASVLMIEQGIAATERAYCGVREFTIAPLAGHMRQFVAFSMLRALSCVEYGAP